LTGNPSRGNYRRIPLNNRQIIAQKCKFQPKKEGVLTCLLFFLKFYRQKSVKLSRLFDRNAGDPKGRRSRFVSDYAELYPDGSTFIRDQIERLEIFIFGDWKNEN
jgi:hypothetical protein